jgi:cell division protein FtsW (lipid II flippase)
MKQAGCLSVFSRDFARKTGAATLVARALDLTRRRRRHVTNFIVYMVGMLLLAGALAYGASLAGISQRWIVVGVLALIGLGVMGGIVKTRQRDPAN